ncbi:MAG: nuclear transport factor 2 family protein [Bacteroidota bacterium]
MKQLRPSVTLPTVITLFWMLCAPITSMGQDSEVKTDHDMVYAAVEDYVMALYNADPSRIERSVDTTLRKIGYYEWEGKKYDNVPMTYDQLYKLSGSWNRDGSRTSESSPKIIDIYEVHDKTASAKLTAEWGIDFMHLSKVDGRWKIFNIMWQRPPK